MIVHKKSRAVGRECMTSDMVDCMGCGHLLVVSYFVCNFLYFCNLYTCSNSFSEARMNKVLTALDIDPVQGISPKARKLVKTLSQAVDALEVANSSLPVLVVAVTELQDDINQTSNDIDALEEDCRVLSEDCKEAKDLFALLHK